MYPSLKYPHYGIFVKNTNDILEQSGYQVDCIAITKTKNKFIKLFKYLFFVLKAIYSLNMKKYDLVYVHYPAFSAIPVRFWVRNKNKLIVNIHGNDLVPEEERDKKYIRNTDIAVKFSNRVVLPSHYFEKEFELRYPNYKKENIFITPSGGVNRDIFFPKSKLEALKELKLNTDYKYIAFVSRIEINKGWDLFIEAVKYLKGLLPEFKYIIVGSGIQEDLLEKMIQENNLEDYIIKYDYLDHKQLSSVYNAIEILSFPSLRKSESLGLVGLEAMACRAIVVSTRGTGPESYIKDGDNGFIMENSTGLDMKNEIIKILNMPASERDQLKLNADKSTEFYSKENTLNNFKKFINAL